MTLSPEERARGLLDALEGIRWPSEAEAIPIIATAIREAENAALERAENAIIDRLLKEVDLSPMDNLTAFQFRTILEGLRPKD